jgi:hypothetical protein
MKSFALGEQASSASCQQKKALRGEGPCLRWSLRKLGMTNNVVEIRPDLCYDIEAVYLVEIPQVVAPSTQ